MKKKGFKVFAKMVRWMDKQIYQLLPNGYYELVCDCDDGISKEVAMQNEERLTPSINKAVNLPVLPENMEGKLIGLILGLINNAMVKGFNLEEAEPEK